MPSPLGLVDFTTPNFTESFTGIPTAHTIRGGRYDSLITRGSKFYYRPIGASNQASASQPDKLYGSADDGSTNDIHNLSLNSVISYTQQEQYPAMFLAAIDFAYLRNLGVYPNNRLVVCRRFPSPAPNDLTAVRMKPISTLVSWYDGDFPIKVDFGENWTDSDGDFVKTLDEMFNLKSTLSGGVSGLTDLTNAAVPLPGLSEGLQLEILKRLGFTDADSRNLPQGNPNLINQAKIREVGTKSGLSSNITLTFKTTYEQKFINNIDPELMFLDIIGNILRFGTSKSEFYLTGKAGGRIREFFSKTFSGDFVGAITILIDTIVEALKAFVELVGAAAKKFGEQLSTDAGAALKDLGSTLLAPILSKYRVKLGGILSALTGEPSTPWHVTVGNPKKPIFSSGDMCVKNVKISFGDTLAFNDMPSIIDVEFTMEGARPYGLQEIFDKFSCGAGRSYVAYPTNFESQVTGNNNLSNTLSNNPAVNPADDKATVLTNDQVQKVANSDKPLPTLSPGDAKRVEDAQKLKDPLNEAQQKVGSVPSATDVKNSKLSPEQIAKNNELLRLNDDKPLGRH